MNLNFMTLTRESKNLKNLTHYLIVQRNMKHQNFLKIKEQPDNSKRNYLL